MVLARKVLQARVGFTKIYPQVSFSAAAAAAVAAIGNVL
jgi:hypothetical protein